MGEAYGGAKRVAIVQSCYIPWKGYFDLIDRVDEFVLLDDAQFTKRDWRNRNRIKTPQGASWLTVPVQVKGRYLQRIDETLVSDPDWAVRHWKTLHHAYSTAACFDEIRPTIEDAYAQVANEPRLSVVNRVLLEAIFPLLGVETALRWSTEFPGDGVKTERLLEICRAVGATEYVSGPSARFYLDEAAFAAHGIAVSWIDYEGYPEYDQLHPPFEHTVSILDVLFNTGSDAARYSLRRSVEAHEHA
jgi:WbqC-like protein family